MPKIGPLELVVILVIVMMIFGAGKLPQIGGALGKSIREFRKAKDGAGEEATAPADKAHNDGKVKA